MNEENKQTGNKKGYDIEDAISAAFTAAETEAAETEVAETETAEGEESPKEETGSAASEKIAAAETKQGPRRRGRRLPTRDEDDEDEEDDDEDDEDEDDEDEDEDAPHSRGKKILIIVLIVLLILFLAVGGFIYYLLSLINYQAADTDYFATVSTEEELPDETPETEALAAREAEELASAEEAEEDGSLEATPEELAQWDKQLEDLTSDDNTWEIPISDDVFNILLIGSDTREEGGVGRSDAMILVSINQKTKKIYLTSFLRDSYVHVPGYGNTRMNHSFAYGGPDLLEETIEENFKVHVDRYVAVDFYSFMDVVDVLGGVYLEVTEEEQEVTNEYIWSMNKLTGEDWWTDYIWNPGYQHLNGKQALCYARNRYVGNDYERTQRQRNIINILMNEAFHSSPSTLVELAQVILPQITTDLTKSEILNYAANAAAYMDYEIVQQQIPATGTYSGATISGMSVISMNMDENIEYLQSTIYEGTDALSSDAAE